MKVGVLLGKKKEGIYVVDLIQKEKHQVVCLISLGADDWDKLVSKVVGIPLVEGKELKEVMKEAKKEYKLRGLVSDVTDDLYWKTMVEKISKDLKLKFLTPLWHRNRESILHDMLNSRYSMRVGFLEGGGFDKSLLGRRVSFEILSELKGFDGEFGVLIMGGPIFSKGILVLRSRRILGENSGSYEVIKTKLR